MCQILPNIFWRIIRIGLVILLALTINSCAQHSRLYATVFDEPTDLQDFFTYKEGSMVLISGHRGGAKNGYPENSIASMRYTLRNTPATFEVDPRLTKDSVVVLMHDATLERTSNGRGKVSDYTWKELQELKLKGHKGNTTEYHIPSLDEVIEWSKGKTVINLDIKNVSPEMKLQKIVEHKAEGHVMLTVHDAEEAKYLYEKNKNIMLSAWIKTKEAFEEYEQTIPWEQVAQAYIGSKITSESKKFINLLHEKGVMVMSGAEPSYDKLPPEERGEAYRELVHSGVDIIESDRLIEVAKAIRSLISVENSKKEFIE